jgi:Fe-S cluster assembly protein SufD
MTETLTDFAPAPAVSEQLRAARSAAIQRASDAGFPSGTEEEWRRSRVAQLELGRFAPAEAAGPENQAAKAADEPIIRAIGDCSRLAVTYEGHLVYTSGPGASGLEVTDLAQSDSSGPALDSPGADVFAELNTALAPSPLLVSVTAGKVVEQPVVISHWVGVDGISAWPRTIVEAGPGSQVTVVELFLSADVESVVVPRTEIRADRDAIVRHVSLFDLGPRVWQFAAQRSSAGPGGSVTAATVALGGGYSRFRIDADLVDDGGEVRLLAAYFGDGEQVQDFLTIQDHTGKRTTSDLVFKGAVTGRARSVYNGLIRVNPGAAASSAFLTNRNLVLSDDAQAYSVPNLEIVNENDLRSCGHAATSGPLDEDQVFYLESRGIPTEVARRLIVLGYFDDVVAKVPVAGLRDVVRQKVGDRLSSTAGIA